MVNGDITLNRALENTFQIKSWIKYYRFRVQKNVKPSSGTYSYSKPSSLYRIDVKFLITVLMLNKVNKVTCMHQKFPHTRFLSILTGPSSKLT